jgi:flagellar biosynthesis protein FlhG
VSVPLLNLTSPASADLSGAAMASPVARGVRPDQAERLRLLSRAFDDDSAAPVSGPLAGGGQAPQAMPFCNAPVLAIASGKGGVGKSNIALNLAIALARRGVRVTVLDADVGVANIDVLCGINPARRLDAAFSPGATRLQDLTIDAPGGFRLVPGSAGLSRLAELTGDQRQQLIAQICELGDHADLLIVDTGAGVGALVTALVAWADMSLIVTTPEPTAIADAYALIKIAMARAPRPALRPDLHIVVNAADSASEAARVHARLSSVSERFLGQVLPMAGAIAADPHVVRAVRMRCPLMLRSPGAPASLAMIALADRVAQSLGLSLESGGGLAVSRGIVRRFLDLCRGTVGPDLRA